MTAKPRPHPWSDDCSAASELTRSELSCLTMIGEGMSMHAICSELALSERELEVLLYCAQRKLEADNLLQAVGVAVAKGHIKV